ncbi:hypothetical protein [Pseudomonas sp. R1-7]|uniref:hypothetical protein n=1 Tax=Pseudomonas sp. R1-7 TaxID=2817398 RepID=UPI003DA8D36A
MSVITVNKDTFTKDVALSNIPVFLAFTNQSKAGLAMEAVLDELASDAELVGKIKVARKEFIAGEALEKLLDVQSAPTTLIIQMETVVGRYPSGWFKDKIKNSLRAFAPDPTTSQPTEN